MDKNIALIGAGYWGKNHLRALYNLGVLNTVVDNNDETLNIMRKNFPDVRYINDGDITLKDPEIKAVVIAVPAKLHYKLAKQYLLAGKDILVEKPLALNIKEGKELVNIAESKNKILMVGHILQYHPAVIKLKQIIDNGELGNIRYIYSSRLNIGKLRVEENVLWSFAPHDISLILMLMDNQEPIKVSAFGGIYVSENIYDTTLTTLEFRGNIKGHIYVSWLHPFKEQKLIVVGSKKMAVFDDTSSEKLLIYPHIIDFNSDKVPITQKAESYSMEIEYKEPLVEELFHFIDCVEKRKIPKTDGEEGLRVLKVLEFAEKSLEIST